MSFWEAFLAASLKIPSVGGPGVVVILTRITPVTQLINPLNQLITCIVSTGRYGGASHLYKPPPPLPPSFFTAPAAAVKVEDNEVEIIETEDRPEDAAPELQEGEDEEVLVEDFDG